MEAYMVRLGKARDVLDCKLSRAQLEDTVHNLVFNGKSDYDALPPSAREDPAWFIVNYCGEDLLTEFEIRRALVNALLEGEGKSGLRRLICKYHDVDPVADDELLEKAIIRRWVRGSGRALAFVKFFGFPEEFAGTKNESYKHPPLTSVEAKLRMKPLHHYQDVLIEELKDWLHDPNSKDGAILVLPTGTGKTRVAGDLIIDYFANLYSTPRGSKAGDVILWIAHTRELCEQAHDAFSKMWQINGAEGKILNIYHFLGDTDVGELIDASGIVIAGIQKLYSTIHDEENSVLLSNYIKRRLKLIIIDEAHLADNESYEEVRKFFCEDCDEFPHRWKLLGLTATPLRSDEERNRNLRRLFPRPIMLGKKHSKDLDGIEREGVFRWMQKNGYLSQVEYEPIYMPNVPAFKLNLAEKSYYKRFHDLDVSALNRLAVDEVRNSHIVERIEKAIVNGHKKILVFACSVAHCRLLSIAFSNKGINALSVTGDMPGRTRSLYIQTFRDEKTNPIVLINYAILTTGFDDPTIDTVLIARPTWSRVLYNQMIGRGLRGEKNGGKDRCLVLDLKDNFVAFDGFAGLLRYDEERDLWNVNQTTVDMK